MFWIPQRSWRVPGVSVGVNTACFHVNRWSPEDISRFCYQVEKHQDKFVSVSSLKETYSCRKKTLSDYIVGTTIGAKVRLNKYRRMRLKRFKDSG